MDTFFHPFPKIKLKNFAPWKCVPSHRVHFLTSDIFFPRPLTKLRQKQVVISLCGRPFLYQRGGRSVLSKRHFPRFWISSNVSWAVTFVRNPLSWENCIHHHHPFALIPNCFQSWMKGNEFVNPSSLNILSKSACAYILKLFEDLSVMLIGKQFWVSGILPHRREYILPLNFKRWIHFVP